MIADTRVRQTLTIGVIDWTYLQDLQILQAVEPKWLAVIIEDCRRRGVSLRVEHRDRLVLHRDPGYQLELVLSRVSV